MYLKTLLIKQNEFITHINNKSISTLSIDEAVKLLKGEVGSIVEITVLNNDLTSRKLNITRGEIITGHCQSTKFS